MGKGDRKTRKGKISKGTFGVTRPRKGKQEGDSKLKVSPKQEAKSKTKPKTRAGQTE